MHVGRSFAYSVSRRELDVLMLGAIFPPYCSVTAKKSLKYVPILGWFSMASTSSTAASRSAR